MIEATINGEPVTGLQAMWIAAFYTIPWLYGILTLIGYLVDRIVEPFLRWIVRKVLCG